VTSGKRISLIGLLLLMEIMPGFAVATGSDYLDSTNVPYDIFWILLLCGAMGICAAEGVRAIKLDDPWDRAVMVTAGAASVAASAWLLPHQWNAIIAGLPLCGIAYWRALVWVDRSVELDDVQHQFGIGFAGIFLGIVWVLARGVTSEGPIWHVLALTGIAYTATALVALTVARTESGTTAGTSVALAVGSMVGILVILGVGALSFFSFDIAGWLGEVTAPFWNLFGLVLVSVIHVLVSPLLWLVDVLHHIVHLRPQHSNQQPPPRPRHHKPLTVAHATVPWIKWVLAALAVLAASLIALVIWRSVPRLNRQQEEKPEEQDGTTRAPVPFWKALLSWLRRLVRPERIPLPRSAAAAARRRLLGPTYPADPVRRLYAQMLHRAEGRGLPRAAAGTPQEFCRKLEGRWPAASGDFAAMTDAYMLRRYGDIAIAEELIEVLKKRWRHARTMMRETRTQV